MGDRIIAYAGKLLVHAVQALLVCWQRMLRLGLSVGTLSGLVALVLGAYVTQSFPPAPLTWSAALFFGFALGYAAAMTVLADEMLLGIFEAIRVLEGDAKAGLRAAAVAAEREAGEAGRGLMRLLGHPRSPQETRPPTPDRAPRSSPLLTVSALTRHEPGQQQADETLAAVAATESFLNTAPRPAVNARPVRADQLPRIGWASEDGDTRRTPQVVAAGALPALIPALAEMPPLPIRTLRSQPPEESSLPAPLPAGREEPDARAGETQAVSQDEAIGAAVGALEATPATLGGAPPAVPAVTASAETQAVYDEAVMPVAGPRPVPVLTRDAGGEAEAVDGAGAEKMAATDGDTAPARERPHAAITRPLEKDREEHGIWTRISQALIGNTTVPLRDVDATGSAGGGYSETSQP